MCFNYSKKNLFVYIPQGWFQDFKLGGGAFKKIVPSGGRRENFGVFRVKNHDFMPKNHIFSNFRGGGGGHPLHPPQYQSPRVRRTSLNFFQFKFF